jgi:predicted chitinase
MEQQRGGRAKDVLAMDAAKKRSCQPWWWRSRGSRRLAAGCMTTRVGGAREGVRARFGLIQ